MATIADFAGQMQGGGGSGAGAAHMPCRSFLEWSRRMPLPTGPAQETRNSALGCPWPCENIHRDGRLAGKSQDCKEA